MLRAAGDEAGVALALAQMADLILAPLGRGLRAILPLSSRVLAAGWQWIRPVVVAAVPVGLVGLAVIAVLGSLVLAGGGVLMPFGWELVSSGLLLEVTAEATPPGGAYAVETLPGDPRSRGLRHSMHELETTRERLAAWIDARHAEWLAARHGA